MKLFFENSQGIERQIASPLSEDEAFKEIQKFLKEHNFKSYYCNIIKNEDFIRYDVGSHTEFFYLRDLKSK